MFFSNMYRPVCLVKNNLRLSSYNGLTIRARVFICVKVVIFIILFLVKCDKVSNVITFFLNKCFHDGKKKDKRKVIKRGLSVGKVSSLNDKTITKTGKIRCSKHSGRKMQ